MNIEIFSTLHYLSDYQRWAIGASENKFINVTGAQSKPILVRLYLVAL